MSAPGCSHTRSAGPDRWRQARAPVHHHPWLLGPPLWGV